MGKMVSLNASYEVHPGGVQDTFHAFEDELQERGQGLKERREFTFS